MVIGLFLKLPFEVLRAENNQLSRKKGLHSKGCSVRRGLEHLQKYGS